MPRWPRLCLDAGLLTRLDGSIQFGLDPSRGVRMDGLSEAEVAWLRTLDGCADPLVKARRAGLDDDRVHTVLALLTDVGLLAPPVPTTVAPGATRVWIEGPGPAGGRLQELLHRMGVAEVARLPTHGAIPRYRRPPDLVVLLTPGAPVAADGARWLDRRVAHLPLGLGYDAASIGPLVPSRGTPCLRCLDLARLDRDPSWQMVAAQARAGDATSAEFTPDETESAIAVGLAAQLVLAHLAGRPGIPGLMLELGRDWPTIRHYRWATHPECKWCSLSGGSALTMGG